MRLTALAVAAGLFWPVSAFSQERSAVFKTGNDLYQDCTSGPESAARTFCLGYVEGASDVLHTMKVVCSPEGVTALQAVDVIVKYLRDHPEARHYTASSEVTLALKKAFPCKEQAH